MKNQKPQCLFLIETKSRDVTIEKISRKLGYYNSFIVDPIGSTGGLAFLWTDEVNVQCCWKSQRILCCVFLRVGLQVVWRFYDAYDTPYTWEKYSFWRMLQNNVLESTRPWLLMGDLNKVINEIEKQKGKPI